MTIGAQSTAVPRCGTGAVGLDNVLGGGLPANRLYLVRGEPGSCKTTIALQFLFEGVRQGERALYITLSETEEEIRQVIDSHGWSAQGLDLFELSSVEQTLRLEDDNTLYATEDVELRETMRVLLDQVDRIKPSRVVFDSLSEVRLLARTATRYRRQILALKQHFAGRRCTVMLLDDESGAERDHQVESLAHGVVVLEQLPSAYGSSRRRLRITKLRGSDFRSGFHDFAVRTGGVVVFPRLVAQEHRTEAVAQVISSGNAALDELLGGGVDRATTTLLIGPSGVGKSSLATQLACGAVAGGDKASLFLFEERGGTLRRRAKQLGLPLDAAIAAGNIHIHQIDPAELAPDEFSDLVRHAVEVDGAKVVLIDSVSSYFTAMPEARFLLLQMHELLSFLTERGVAVVLTIAQTGLMGSNMAAPVDVSYLPDTVIMLRYFEAEGRVRKAISVLKKRSGAHADTIHEYKLGTAGIHIGKALADMRGVLLGVPTPCREEPIPASMHRGEP